MKPQSAEAWNEKSHLIQIPPSHLLSFVPVAVYKSLPKSARFLRFVRARLGRQHGDFFTQIHAQNSQQGGAHAFPFPLL